jgi:hypothetical protein
MSRNDISRFPFDFSELVLTEFSNKMKESTLPVEQQAELYSTLQKCLLETADRMYTSLDNRITSFAQEVAQQDATKSSAS